MSAEKVTEEVCITYYVCRGFAGFIALVLFFLWQSMYAGNYFHMYVQVSTTVNEQAFPIKVLFTNNKPCSIYVVAT